MNIFEILSPILLIVVLCFLLTRVSFLGSGFIGDLNKPAFWVALKTALVPAHVFALAPVFGLGSTELRIAMVLGAAPTAAGAFVMARQMDGDGTLASG